MLLSCLTVLGPISPRNSDNKHSVDIISEIPPTGRFYLTRRSIGDLISLNKDKDIQVELWRNLRISACAEGPFHLSMSGSS